MDVFTPRKHKQTFSAPSFPQYWWSRWVQLHEKYFKHGESPCTLCFSHIQQDKPPPGSQSTPCPSSVVLANEAKWPVWTGTVCATFLSWSQGNMQEKDPKFIWTYLLIGTLVSSQIWNMPSSATCLLKNANKVNLKVQKLWKLEIFQTP